MTRTILGDCPHRRIYRGIGLSRSQANIQQDGDLFDQQHQYHEYKHIMADVNTVCVITKEVKRE
jgi:hypothetical protein